MAVKLILMRMLAALQMVVLWWLATTANAKAADVSGPLVQVGKVKSWQAGRQQQMYCKVQAPHHFQVASQGDAQLLWRMPVGSEVAEGQLLAEQDGFYLERRVARLTAELASAGIQADFSVREFERLRSLDQQQLVSPSQLNDLARASKQAKLTVERLAEELKEAKYRLAHLKHYAPVTGQILAVQAQPGEHLSVGQRIVSILPAADQELLCEWPLAQYRQITAIEQVRFSLDGLPDNPVALTLARISRQLAEATQTVQVYLRPKEGAVTGWLTGERLQVTAAVDAPELSRVPYDAVSQAEAGHFVWRLDAEHKVDKLPVRVVATREQHFLVESTLKAGDLVVTLGKRGLTPAQQVRPATGNEESSS